MDSAKDIRVAVAGLSYSGRDDLVEAMAERGWRLDEVADIHQLACMVAAGQHHLAVVACRDPRKLPREPLRTLMSMQTDMSVVFLVPKHWDAAECAPLMGATSDQIHKSDAPAADLMEVLDYELRSVLSDRPEYRVVCIDDDEDFLTSLKECLRSHLLRTPSRFSLSLQLFSDPREALEEIVADRTNPPAVVISDQIMPYMKGVELLGKVKAAHPATRRRLLTGHGSIDSAVAAINEHTLDKYFFKPIEDSVDFTNNIRHLVLEYHLHTRTARQRARLMSQFEFIRTISAARNIDKALSVTVGYLREQLRPEKVIIALTEEDQCTISAAFGLPAELPLGSEVGRYAPFAQVLRSGRPVVTRGNGDSPSDTTTGSLGFSTFVALPLIWRGATRGVMLAADPLGNRPFTREERVLLSFFADVTAMTVSGHADRHALENVYLSTMAALLETVEAKDAYTRGHTDRVTDLAVALAKQVGIKGQHLKDVQRGAMLHDIGKIAVPDKIILKPGFLNDEERSIIQEHPGRADRILQHLRFLNSVRMIARAHHERYDGVGYPDGLQAQEIPLGARIIAIADSYDAMISARPYRDAMKPCEALSEIEANAGRQFDPGLVAVFVRMMRQHEQAESLSAAEAGTVS